MNLKEVASRIKAMRVERDLKISQVAERCGVSRQLMSQYEKGKVNIGCEMLCRLADFYGLSTDYLLGRTDIKNLYRDENDMYKELQNLKSHLKGNIEFLECISKTCKEISEALKTL